MVQLYPTDTPTFIEHHGRDGTARYLRAAAMGIELQKALAKKLFGARVDAVMDERGSGASTGSFFEIEEASERVA